MTPGVPIRSFEVYLSVRLAIQDVGFPTKRVIGLKFGEKQDILEIKEGLGCHGQCGCRKPEQPKRLERFCNLELSGVIQMD